MARGVDGLSARTAAENLRESARFVGGIESEGTTFSDAAECDASRGTIFLSIYLYPLNSELYSEETPYLSHIAPVRARFQETRERSDSGLNNEVPL